jgi:hypothetical protein
VLAFLDVDVGELAARREVEVELVGRGEVAAAGDSRLHDAARDGDRAFLSARGRRRADDHDGDDDCRDRERGQDDRRRGWPADRAPSHQLAVVSLGVASCCCWGGPFCPRFGSVTPHFCSAARSF